MATNQKLLVMPYDEAKLRLMIKKGWRVEFSYERPNGEKVFIMEKKKKKDEDDVE